MVVQTESVASDAAPGSVEVVGLSAARLSLQPGEAGSIRIKLRNRSGRIDQFRLRVGGVDARWISLDQERSTLFPGDTGEVAFGVRVPADAVAETSRLVPRIDSMDAQQSLERELDLQVLPTGGFGVQLLPRRVSGAEARFRVELSNPSNAERLLDLM